MRFRLRVLALAVLLGGAAAQSPAQAAEWRPNDDDALLFDARLGAFRIGEGIRGYQTSGGVCVDLSDMVAALDIPVTIDPARGMAEGWAFEERNRLRIDRRAGTVRTATRQSAIASGSVHDADGGWCVTLVALSEWLGIELRADLANALLFVKAENKLPVELAAERRARAARTRPAEETDLAGLPQARLPYRLWRTPSLDVVAQLGGVSDKQRDDQFERSYELYAAGELAWMSADARLSSDRDGVPSDFRIRAYRTDSDGGLLGPLHATHVALGDISTFGSPLTAQSVAGRGAVVTNRPIGRQVTFDRKTFRGELPNGWDAELYRNGQLLDSVGSRADGRYEFVDVPLLYGDNRFEIVLYGPQGQLRRQRETVVVGAESIPPRETWYWASVAEDEQYLFNLRSPVVRDRGWRGAFGLERGLDARTSASLQVHSLVLRDERLTYAETSLRRSLGPALVEIGASLEEQGGYAARAQLLGQFGETFVSAESVVAHDYVSDRIDSGVTGRHAVALDHAISWGRWVLPVHVEARYVDRLNGDDTLEGSARVSTMVSRIAVTAALDWRRQRTDPGAVDRLETALLANGGIGSTRVRGELRWRLAPENRFESGTLVAQRPIGVRTDMRGEIGYERSLDRFRSAIGYVRRFDHFALSATIEAASDGSVAGGLNVAFSLGRDPKKGGLRVTSAKLAANGTAVARIFHDANGDGLRQPDEPAAANVQVTVGRSPVETLTDSSGLVVLDRLEPHRPVLVGIDAASISDPFTQPPGPGVVVTPRPGLAVAFDLPLVSAGEVIGTLNAVGGRTLEGIDLELVDNDGRVAAVTRSDFDGFFQFERVPYGSYRLRIAKLSAQAARLHPDLPQKVTVGSDAPTAQLGRVMAGSIRDAGLAAPR